MLVADLITRRSHEVMPHVSLVEQLESHLRGHPGCELSTAARVLGYSGRTLQRKLARSDCSFAELRLKVRLDHARRKLAGTSDKVAAIATEVGFASASHFTSWFCRSLGLTPSEFRRLAVRCRRDG